MNKFIDSIISCIQNGKRLLNEAELLEYEDPPSTQYYISIIAQEEFAKGFLLYLAHAKAIPWNASILRATRDHKCKQLVCIVLDYMTDIDTFLSRINKAINERDELCFPSKVADALNILRHEKIGRWESRNWFWAEDPDYDPESEAIAEGKMDNRKQDALYVRLGTDGSIVSIPQIIKKEDARAEFERGRRFERFMEEIVQDRTDCGLDYDRIKNAFKILFTIKS